MERIAEVLVGLEPDVVLLQEVDRHRPQTQMNNQAAYLARVLNMEYAYGAVRHYRLGSYGNAILSRNPIVKYTNHILPGESDNRCCLEGEIRTPRLNFSVFCLHLGLLYAERCRHLQDIILPRLETISHPVLLGGDFNALPESTEVRLVGNYLQDSFKANSGSVVHTFPSDQPQARIDYVFLDGCWQLNDYIIIAHSLASDHLPVMCKAGITAP